MEGQDRLRAALGTSLLRERVLQLGVGALLLLVLTLGVVKLSPVYVIGALLGLIGTVFFFARPEIGLYVYFGFRILADILWWVPVSFGGFSALEALSGGFTLLAAVLFYLELRRVERHPVFGALLLYILVLTLSAIRASDARDGAEIIARYMSPFLMMFIVTALFRDPQGWRRVMGIFAWVGGIPVLISLYHLATGQMGGVSLAGINRLLGGYENLHNHAHAMLVLAAVYAFWFFEIPRGRLKWLAGAAMSAALLCLYLSYVRTALLGFAVFIFVFALVERRWTLLGSFVLAGSVLLVVSQTMRDRFSDLLLVFDNDPTQIDYARLGSGRMGVWTSSMEHFLKQPVMDLVLGAGLGGHWAMVQDYLDQFRSSRGGTLGPHNDYLALLYQLGPVSVFCYLMMQVEIVLYAVRLRAQTTDRFIRTFTAYATSMSCVVFVTNMISQSFLTHVTAAMVAWVSAGLLFAMVQHVRHQREPEAKAPSAAPRMARPLPARAR